MSQSPPIDVTNSSNFDAPPSTNQTLKVTRPSTNQIQNKFKRRRIGSSEEQQIQESEFTSEGAVEESDEIDAFGRRLAAILRNYREDYRKILQSAIDEVLFNADTTPFHDNIRSFSTSPSTSLSSPSVSASSSTKPSSSSQEQDGNHRSEASTIYSKYGVPGGLDILEEISGYDRMLFAVETRGKCKRYGRVFVEEGKIFIYSFDKTKYFLKANFDRYLLNRTRFVAFDELLTRFTGSAELPKTTFLELAPRLEYDNYIDEDSEDDFSEEEEADKLNFNVVIETDGVSQRAKTFVELCSGLNGGRPDQRISGIWGDTGKDSYSCDFTSIRLDEVTKNIRDDDPQTPLIKGGVYGMEQGLFCFEIVTKNRPSESNVKFGTVIKGLQNVKRLKRGCFIEQCGLVIDRQY